MDYILVFSAAGTLCASVILLGLSASVYVVLVRRLTPVDPGHSRSADLGSRRYLAGRLDSVRGRSSSLPPDPAAGLTLTPSLRAVTMPAHAGAAAQYPPTASFGPYRLDSLLGRGAMGEVWRALDTRRDRYVALKLLPSHPEGRSEAPERMQREAQLAGRLSSAHVIPVHDFGWIDGEAFLDMRLVPGGDLAALLREHPQGLEPRRAARIVAQIADALDAAHRAGLVHCDVKPSNVLLDTTAAGDFCYLADFGVARLASTTALGPTPSRGPIFGTPTYMAPELFTDDDVTAGPSITSDVYALAVLFHELLTGRPPFTGTSLRALQREHTSLTPPPVSSAAPSLAALDPILTRALAKSPNQRHTSAGAFAAAVTSAVDIGPSAFTPIVSETSAAALDLDTGAAALRSPYSNHPSRRLTLRDGKTPAPEQAPDDSLEAVFLPAPGPATGVPLAC